MRVLSPFVAVAVGLAMPSLAGAASRPASNITEARIVPVGEDGVVDASPSRGWGAGAAMRVEGWVAPGLRDLLAGLGANETQPLLTGTAFSAWFAPAPDWRVGLFWQQSLAEDERPLDADRLAQIGTRLWRRGFFGQWQTTRGVWRLGAGAGIGLGWLAFDVRRVRLGGVGEFDDYLRELREGAVSTTWTRSVEGSGPTGHVDLGAELQLVDWFALQVRGGWQAMLIPAQGWVDVATSARPGGAPSRALHGWNVTLGVVAGRLGFD